MPEKRYVPDARVMSAPKLPLDRPPTRAEVWAHYHHIYFDLKGHKPNGLCTDSCLRTAGNELEDECRSMWAWMYVSRLRKGWDKPPDWQEGDPFTPGLVPAASEFSVDNIFNWPKMLYGCIDRAKKGRTP